MRGLITRRRSGSSYPLWLQCVEGDFAKRKHPGRSLPIILWLLLLYDQLTVLHPYVADEIREF